MAHLKRIFTWIKFEKIKIIALNHLYWIKMAKAFVMLINRVQRKENIWIKYSHRSLTAKSEILFSPRRAEHFGKIKWKFIKIFSFIIISLLEEFAYIQRMGKLNLILSKPNFIFLSLLFSRVFLNKRKHSYLSI